MVSHSFIVSKSVKDVEISINKFFSNKIIRNEEGFVLDMQSLKEQQPKDYEEFLDKPKYFISKINDHLQKQFDVKGSHNFRIINFSDEEEIANLRIDHLEKLVSFRGMISSTTKVIARIKSRVFECPSCGTMITVLKNESVKGCSCGRRGNFQVVKTEFQNVQEIVVEEPQDEIEGRQPQKIRIRLLDDLTDQSLVGMLQPGNKIKVIGVVQEEKLANKGKQMEELLYEYKVEAFNIFLLDEKFNKDTLSEEDIKVINEIACKEDPLDYLSESLAPEIYGHNDIKKALVLQMVGGVKRDGFRDRTHILLCGDPGVAKSKLAENVHKRMPKSHYISGDETTKAGLVAIVERDPFLGDWSLKAGALSKANDSILIIDELDKINPADRDGLHTPMEKGVTIITKADRDTTLKADCSILGIANPVYGMFDMTGSKTLSQQIDIVSSLLSRFDLVFAITDKIDEELDHEIVNKIYNTEKSAKGEMSISLFRKYVSYARSLKPKRTKGLEKELGDFFHDLRKRSVSPDKGIKGMPVISRHIQGVIRLAEARAKLRLSETVDKEDFEFAKKLFYDSLIKLGMDEESNIIDMGRISSSVPFSKRGEVQKILEIINELTDKIGSLVPVEEIISKAEEVKIKKYNIYEYLNQLRKSGQIFEPRNGFYSMIKF